jgi:hypothetical protein
MYLYIYQNEPALLRPEKELKAASDNNYVERKIMLIIRTLSLLICMTLGVVVAKGQQPSKPPMGWNSFDSYGVYLHEQAAFDNLHTMAIKLKPYSYTYFVIDNSWFGEYKLEPGTNLSLERHASDLRINEYGLLQPSKTYFPNGFKKLIDSCHALRLKFGLHLMRG